MWNRDSEEAQNVCLRQAPNNACLPPTELYSGHEPAHQTTGKFS